MIIKTHTSTKYTIVHHTDEETIVYAISAYGFLLKPGKYTWCEFADLIDQYYSNDRSAYITQILRKQ